MSAAKLALPGGVAAVVALLVVLWAQRDGGNVGYDGGAPIDAIRATVVAVELPGLSAGASATVASPPQPRPLPAAGRATEAELQAQLAAASNARIGGLLVEHLVEHGLALSDAELVVHRFFDDGATCFFDALRAEAAAQSVDYDSVLDAIEAELYDSDGPLLPAVIDLRAVVDRVAPCSLRAAQQAGLEPAALEEAARAAIRRPAP